LNDTKKRKSADADGQKRDRFAGMSRAKRRRLQLSEEDHKDIQSHAGAIKTAKKALKPSKMTKLAAERPATKPQDQKKKRKKKDVDFSRDLADGSKKGASGAKQSSGGSKGGRDKKDDKKKDRGGKLGKLRGNKAFKSSKKYKRR